MSADWRHTTPGQLLASHLTRPGNTARAYADDLRAFAAFLKVDDPEAAVRIFVDSERGAARRVLEDWKNANRAAGMSLATTRRRMSSLLALLRLAHEYDVIPWSLRVSLPAADPVRDTRGPGRQAIENMIILCAERDDAKGHRDEAMICLMFYNALRAGEVLSIDVAHVDLKAGEVSVSAKGKWDRVRIAVPLITGQALERWLRTRGDWPGPLFPSMQPHRRERGERLTYRGLYEVVKKLGRQVGVTCHPHGFRHSAATELDRLTHGNVGWGMSLTRHRDPRTFMAYRDGRVNRQRQAAEILAAGRYCQAEPPTVDTFGSGFWNVTLCRQRAGA